MPEDNSEHNKDTEKLEKRELEKEEILRYVADAKTDTVLHRVAWLLNYYPETRDSDITCQLKYWSYFEQDIYNPECISSDDLYKLTKLTSITRARAKIQNTHRLFLASPDVRKKRGVLEEEEKEKAIQQKSNFPVYAIYADESGKTQDFLIVGSMWILNGIDTLKLYNAIKEWRQTTGFKHELHFNKISSGNIDYYRQVLEIVRNKISAISFKAISIERKGISNMTDALMLLYYYLLIGGVDHEHNTGRAPLPRNIQLWKDAEETGADKLMLKQIKEKLEQAAKIKFDDKLIVDELRAVDSKNLELIQLADLFTGSINRKLNAKGDGEAVKDQFANEFLKKFGLNDKLESFDGIGDCAFYTSL
jgi:hypothetical protein